MQNYFQALVGWIPDWVAIIGIAAILTLSAIGHCRNAEKKRQPSRPWYER